MQWGERRQSHSLHTAWKTSVKNVTLLLVQAIFMLLLLNVHYAESLGLIQKQVQLKLRLSLMKAQLPPMLQPISLAKQSTM